MLAALHPIFAKKYLHNFKNDEILICEAFRHATQTVKTIFSEEMVTQKSDKLTE